MEQNYEKKSIRQRAEEAHYQFMNNGDLMVEGAVIMWKNFSGNPVKGERGFFLNLSEEFADLLEKMGWNIVRKPPYQEGADPVIGTNIKVNLASKYPPTLNLCTEWNGRKTMHALQDEKSIAELDGMGFADASVIIHPYEHNTHGFVYKGYLKTLTAIQANRVQFGGRYSDYENNVQDEEGLPWD